MNPELTAQRNYDEIKELKTKVEQLTDRLEILEDIAVIQKDMINRMCDVITDALEKEGVDEDSSSS